MLYKQWTSDHVLDKHWDFWQLTLPKWLDWTKYKIDLISEIIQNTYPHTRNYQVHNSYWLATMVKKFQKNYNMGQKLPADSLILLSVNK